MEKILTLLIALSLLAVACQKTPESKSLPSENQNPTINSGQDTEPSNVIFDFSILNPVYLFSAKTPGNLRAEYISGSQSINIYDPALPGENNLEKSRIFVRHFKASSFLTLSTVNIISRESADVHGHAAVRYEIEKKSGVANFPNQPLWRSQKHKLIDIRLEPAGTTYFYVFSYSPEFPENEFEDFIQSLKFENDPAQNKQQGLKDPLSNALFRITKKPFGLKVDPGNSPVNPEKFNGFHNAVDFEILPGEEEINIVVFAICEGKLLQKKQASGYGGVVVQACIINGETVTVIYGHLKLSSITAKINDNLPAGSRLGVLGKGFSEETGGERKHLHLGIHKGRGIDIRGYVQTENELAEWLDFTKNLF